MLASFVVVLALVVGVSTWLVAERGDSETRNGQRDATPTPSGSKASGLTDEAVVQRRDAITELLEGRSRAILGRDRPAFLALIDPAAGRFKDLQATIFDRLAKVPLATWDYDYAGEGPPLVGYLASLMPKGSFVARVNLRYTFVGNDSHVESQQFLTLVQREGSWLFAGDRDNVLGATSGAFGQDIWELGPVTVVHGRSSLVLGAAKASVLREYAQQADRAVRDVNAVWKGKWSRRPVVIVPRTQADMAAVIGTSEQIAGQITAVAIGYFEADLTHGDRVVINPAAWREIGAEGRQIVMTHEVTHLATRAATGTVPTWMAEGFADYVAYQAVDFSQAEIVENLLDLVRDGEGPRELPEDRDFDPAYGVVETAYEEGLLVVQMIAERYGEQELVELYQAMADEDDPVGEDIRAILGISSDKLVGDWRDYMQTVAGE